MFADPGARLHHLFHAQLSSNTAAECYQVDFRQALAVSLLRAPESCCNITWRFAVSRFARARPVLANFRAAKHRLIAICLSHFNGKEMQSRG